MVRNRISELAEAIRTHPERMTARARFYLATTCAAHFSLAVLCLAVPQTFASPSYEVILEGVPLWLSGVVFGLASSVCGVAALSSSAQLARLGLSLSFVASGTWTVGLIGAVFLGNPAGFTAPIVWGTLAVKDGLQCLVPQRLPLEPVIAHVLHDQEQEQEQEQEQSRAEV